MNKCFVGLDFGTLSCRGVAIDSEDGRVIATAESPYRHGVIEGRMAHKDIPLPPEWYLQDPEDWLESMTTVVRGLLKNGNIPPEAVAALGTDFTSCTLIPCRKDGTPLCLEERFKDEPNAWPKLWKHHGAQIYVEEIEKKAKEHTTWLREYFGNAVSCEWAFPKILQVVRESPEVYEAADYFVEAVDWIVLKLTGRLVRTAGVLGVNSFYIGGRGYPDREFCRLLDPLMEDVSETKLAGEIGTVGQRAGTLSPEMAERLGLTTDVVVPCGHSDGAVAGCGAGITESGSIMLVMGTSTCHQMMYKDFRSFEGLCSIAEDGMIPGLYGYESGQSATGDIFGWFANALVPESYYREAERRGESILQYMGELADALAPGESGLIALDWLNGNRSILSNYDLSGLIVGLTLQTKTEEIYRALVEANIFGSKCILDNYEENGVHISKIYAVGGIAKKSPWIMQMCADVFNSEIVVPTIDNVPATGSAVCAAVALGAPVGCADFHEASKRLFHQKPVIYSPDPTKVGKYRSLYGIYRQLHDAFGREMDVMKELKSIRRAERSYNK